MICSKCGYENLDENKFCENCGEALTKQEVLYKKLHNLKIHKDFQIQNTEKKVRKSTNETELNNNNTLKDKPDDNNQHISNNLENTPKDTSNSEYKEFFRGLTLIGVIIAIIANSLPFAGVVFVPIVAFFFVLILNCQFNTFKNRLQQGMIMGGFIGTLAPIGSTIIWHLLVILGVLSNDNNNTLSKINTLQDNQMFVMLGGFIGVLVIPMLTISSSVLASALAGSANQK